MLLNRFNERCMVKENFKLDEISVSELNKYNVPVTVIITVFNDSIFLEQALNSIINQSSSPEEILVINDGSTNYETKNINFIINKYLSLNIKYFKKGNGGVSSARNVGIENAKCKFIMFLDCDDQLLPDCIKILYNTIFELDNTYFGVYGWSENSNNHILKFIELDGAPSSSQIGRERSGIPGGASSYIFNRENILEIGGFDTKLTNYEDFDLIARFILRNFKVLSTSQIVYKINLRNESASRNNNYIKILNNTLFFLKIAEKSCYFSERELNKRYKEAYLSSAKHSIYLGLNHFNHMLILGFNRSRPNNFIQLIFFLYVSVLNNIIYRFGILKKNSIKSNALEKD